MELIKGGITAPQGFKASGISAGIKKNGKKDVAIVCSEVLCKATSVYTINKFKAAPLIVTGENLANKRASAIVINSGVANACMGAQGLEDAKQMALITGEVLNINELDVVVASTGVIGVPLPMKNVKNGIIEAAKIVAKDGNIDAAEAIMTTDSVMKELAYTVRIGNCDVKIGAMAKGSGMIHPNMATMLGFITTDANIEENCLDGILKEAVKASFNMISVDGDTSTNDMVVIMANGMANNEEINTNSENLDAFKNAITHVCTELAKLIAKDGEGATKLLEVEVIGALSLEDARLGAKSICSSNLVKTAMFGEDANWGRIVTALGYSGAEIDPLKVDVYLGNLLMAKAGTGLAFDEDKALEVLKEKDVKVKVDLNLGTYSAKSWGCDLSYEYVRINGEYRS
ncbi:N-acetylglutamate synthase /glutamate N-acetyltransferase [Desulfonispora thiosulfatigenes DSM 11270]|uniref:Arginine biosynthesis bifunctional protein ArgJ n=1 Tax=Desulfonispora thiosulfatigenes DSM 11270 TaxID=656914 RepID=A0A1W1URC6_DESTI|nr:bifunctional glutamate N-acetyltransferase/amino-acid acetyltransferase ArgJ [Desulfonispora thiosulfatigenes]SMB83593.1 N-acetylglutamate synthase /glutamate N-acetyltransferase [Desulfonispora thiosulfatigenes DSM 11270]